MMLMLQLVRSFMKMRGHVVCISKRWAKYNYINLRRFKAGLKWIKNFLKFGVTTRNRLLLIKKLSNKNLGIYKIILKED